ncbi:helix-turn-helix domain-containing protein [Sinorhizobium fredii]|uniref:helix-turn-helix domain-containing protein n=1 Tax=Rhizobium fredii TaxID=380 RepID=UPI003516956C
MLSPDPERTKGKPNPVDIHVGRRIRMRRVRMDMPQAALADAIGVTFQQVQKYEKGSNRVGASRLQQIADALEVSASYFFDDMPGELKVNGGRDSGAKANPHPEVMEFVSSDEGIALIRAFIRIRDEKVRTRMISLVKALAEEGRQ